MGCMRRVGENHERGGMGQEGTDAYLLKFLLPGFRAHDFVTTAEELFLDKPNIESLASL